MSAGDIPFPASPESIPPPGSSGGYAAVPPPIPEAQARSRDVLRRRKKISWKTFGGDGFLVSVAFHVLLVIAGLFYVVSRYVGPKAKPETEVFATGSGGGQNGDKAKAFEHRLKAKLTTPVKSPSRIVSRNANAAVALPSTPAAATTSFASGLASGGMSKGSGGGTGGGEGTGNGIGKGGGRNFVSLFGARGLNVAGLPGIFYDAKQRPDGTPTKYEPVDAAADFTDDVLRPLVKHWDPVRLDGRFFRAPESLLASQIFAPLGDASTAPQAFGVGDKVKGSRWIAWYRGAVVAPKSGRFRFWGYGDDALVVRWERKFALDSGWTILSSGKGRDNYGSFVGKPLLGVTDVKKYNYGAPPVHAGPWFRVQKGDAYQIEIVLSEIPGGKSGFWLMMEEADPLTPSKPDGKLFLFRMSDAPLPDGLVQDTGLDVDMTGKGLIWMANGGKAKSVR